MLEVHAIAGPTGRLLKEMLKEKGLIGGQIKGAVNYGYGGQHEVPTLNAQAGCINKYEELVAIKDADIPTVPFDKGGNLAEHVLFGRRLHHTRGRDILEKVSPISARTAATRDYWTGLIPKKKEFRVWAFRDKHLATYEKVRDYHRGQNGEVWNWRNGYAYHFVNPDAVAQGIKNIGIDSVEALDLDFGAVDVLLGQDNCLYVLEVNTAPGVEGRRQGITSLVNSIERWAKNGFKARGK